jgi:alkanesulfonate monooxygenase SsuD/methylene tetrahydromethanopterin reductase-like flavin-dependent oxidoreductase (luciferase family)
MQLGIYTFGDLTPDPHSGVVVSPRERMRQMLTLARLADDAGLDILGVGEHHAAQFVNSATAATIAAMAAVTQRIRLTSASTLLSTADPVRTFQEFATADLVSNGRVEIVFGRGAFTDNFPLFGFDLKDYDALFIEKLELFAALNSHERVTWSGRFRPPLHNAVIAPRPVQPFLPVWIGAGSPQTATRAASMGYPLAIPMLGGRLTGYVHLAELYRTAWRMNARPAGTGRLAIYSHLHVADTSQQAREDFYPYYSAYLKPLFKGPLPSAQFAQMLSSQGGLLAGSPQEVVDKLLSFHEAIGMDRYVGQIDVGGLPFATVARSLELYATRVAPVVRKAMPPPDPTTTDL